MTRFVVGVLCGVVLGVVGPAGATVLEPAPASGVPAHPSGTVGPLIVPAVCDVVGELQAEQHRRNQVRELVVTRLRCEAGDRRRTVVQRGPWVPAFEVERFER